MKYIIEDFRVSCDHKNCQRQIQFYDREGTFDECIKRADWITVKYENGHEEHFCPFHKPEKELKNAK